MDCSTPDFPVHHQLPGAYSNSCPLSWWCHPTISSSFVPFSSCPRSFPAPGSFPVSQHFAPGVQSIWTSASASVLPVTIQGWFPLGLTGWISLESKGLSRVFSSITAWKHQSSGLSLLYTLCKPCVGFPGGSDSKESACNARDLDWEDSLEEDIATHSSIHAWRIPMNRGAWWHHGRVDMTERLSTAHSIPCVCVYIKEIFH